jgi:PAS domain S-box-containing protein
MKPTNSSDESINLQPGDHLCCLYGTDQEQRALLSWFFRQGLERGDKVRYIVDSHPQKAAQVHFHDTGFDPEPYLASGQLGVLAFDETYMKRGFFDPPAMIDLLGAEMERSLAEGYQSLRVTAEMSWALRGLPGSERLIEYEAQLNELFPGSNCIGVCQYDRRLFPPTMLIDVLTTHPLVMIGTEPCKNFYYMPPQDLFSGDPTVRLDHWLYNLKEHNRAEEEIKIAYEELKRIFNTATDGMRVIDREFNILRINETFSKLTGMSKEEAVGKKCFEVFGGPVCHTANCTLNRILRGEKLVEFEVERKRSDGTRIPCIIRAVPIQAPDGNVLGIIEDFKDISERKLVEEHVRLLPQKLLRAQEKSRQKIARDLHDQVAQDLATVKIGCDTLVDTQPSVPGEIKQLLSSFSRILQGSITAVRDLICDLRPPSLDQLGLIRTVSYYCQEFSEKTGVRVFFDSVGLDSLELDTDIEINLYRLIQESLNNVKKHADARYVIIGLIASFPNINLRIEDDGKGFDVSDKSDRALQEKRLGLQSMEERVNMLGGKMRIRSYIDEGTTIFIEIPCKEKINGSEHKHPDH